MTQGDGELATLDSIYKQMASQGQNLFAAAGDSGAFDNGGGRGGSTLPAVDYPASDPYVTGRPLLPRFLEL